MAPDEGLLWITDAERPGVDKLRASCADVLQDCPDQDGRKHRQDGERESLVVVGNLAADPDQQDLLDAAHEGVEALLVGHQQLGHVEADAVAEAASSQVPLESDHYQTKGESIYQIEMPSHLPIF